MTTRLTFNPRLRIKVLFPKLVGFAVDAICGPGSLTLLSALGSGTDTSAAGTAPGVDDATGEAAATDVGVVRVSFAAGGVDVVVADEVREDFSSDGTAATVAGEDAGVIDVEARDAFSVGEAAAIVVGAETAGVAGEVCEGFSAGGAAATVVDEEVAVVAGVLRDGVSFGGAVAAVTGEELAVAGGKGRDSFSPNGTVVPVIADVVTADDGGAADVVSTVVAEVPFVGAAEFGVGAGDAAFAVGTDVTVTGGAGDTFDEDVAVPVVAGVMVAVTGGVRDAVTVGDAGATDGEVSVIARF
jgi:hypothetical protein